MHHSRSGRRHEEPHWYVHSVIGVGPGRRGERVRRRGQHGAGRRRCEVLRGHATRDVLFANDGLALSGNDQIPFANAGVDVYDGNGHIRSIYTISINGKISRFIRVTGTYNVKSDCTGTARYSDGTRYDQFVAPDGSQIVFIETNRGTVDAASEVRVSANKVGN